MKELDRFTTERLESLCDYRPNRIANLINFREVASLARIALAAKMAEPVMFRFKYPGERNYTYITHRKPDAFEMEKCEIELLYTIPQLNSPEIPDGWIKCSDRMPGDDEFVRIWPLPDFGVELHVGQYIKFHANGPGWFAQVYEQNYGVEFYPITVTHWMPLPDAPEKGNG